MTEERKKELIELAQGEKFEMDKYKALDMCESYYIFTQKRESKEEVDLVKAKFFYDLSMQKIMQLPKFYILMLEEINIPFIYCDDMSYDDEAFVFTDEELAKNYIEIFKQRGIKIKIEECAAENYLNYYALLVRSGANLIIFYNGVMAMPFNLKDICTEPKADDAAEPEKKILSLSNKELALTINYFMQENLKPEGIKDQRKIQELQEEMMANFEKGEFIVPIVPAKDEQEEKHIAFLKDNEDNMVLPLFTDIGEMAKNEVYRQCNVVVAKSEDIKGMFTEGVKGISINPFGANVRFGRQE